MGFTVAPLSSSQNLPRLVAVVTALMVQCVAISAVAEVEIRNVEPESVRDAVEASGWTVFGGAATSRNARAERWLWSVGRGERAGSVLLARFPNPSHATAAALQIEKRGGAAHVRAGTLLAVVVSRDATSGAQLLSSLLRAVGGGAVSSSSGDSPVVSVSVGAELPSVRFGKSPRPDIIAAVIGLGWDLSAAPTVVHSEGYDAVAYSLEHPSNGALDVTVYDCHTAATAAEIAKLKKRTDFAALRRGAVVVVVRGGKSVVTPVVKSLERLP
jgi:hypothetical protein